MLGTRAQQVTDAARESTNFKNTLDSLFLSHQLEEVIRICRQPHPVAFTSACTYNLIGAYYCSRDSLSAWTLLNKEIARVAAFPDADAYSLEGLLGKDYTAYRKFLRLSTAKSYILTYIDSFYQTEAVTDKKNSLELLHLLTEDQWIRNTSSLYDKFRPGRRHLLPSLMDSAQAIQAQTDHCNEVFRFYKSRNNVFSKAEVGRIYYWQLMLFFHDWNLEHRRFYQELVRQGVARGALSLEDQMNFEVGTELIQMGIQAFGKHREEIQEGYRKKYAMPNYRIRLM